MQIKRMKDDRSIVPYLILGVLTFGIYPMWCIHHLAEDVNELCADSEKKSSGVAAYILLSLLTLGLYSFFWWFRIADMLGREAKKQDVDTSLNGGYMLVCMLLGAFMCGIASYVGIHKVFETTNELASKYNARLRTKSALGITDPEE